MQSKDYAKPGIKAGLSINEASLEEQKILKRLAKLFSIGFFRKVEFKMMNYVYVFGKPSGDFTLKFNIDTEILILFNKLDVFEKRTLDIVDKLLTEYYNRLDKYCVILISNDNLICNKVESINAGEKISRVFVPFTYTELLDDHANNSFIEARFKKFFYVRDLFDLDSPIKSESFFFGRSKIVHEFYEKYTNSENSALFGLRKIGKTSVLYAVKRLFESKELPVVYIDCQSPSIHKRKWYETLEQIINLAFEQMPGINKELIKVREYTEKDAASQFENDLKKISILKNGNRILLIFDEIENITFDISSSEHWNKGDDFLLFWQTLRSIFQSNRDIFSFIIAGVNPHILEITSIRDHDNPIFKIATPKYLNLFSAETIKEMVSTIGLYMGLVFDEEVFYLLHEDFGGHPFLTRVACSNINKLLPDNRPVRVSKFWYRNNRTKFVFPVISYVEQLLSVLKNFYQNEYQMLEVLANNELELFGEIVHSSPRAAEHLEGYGLVNMSDSQYYFRLKIIEDYIVQTNSIIKLGLTTEDKWEAISKRRNPLEKKLRNLAVIILKAHYGNNYKSKFLNVIDEKRKVKLENLTIEEIFQSHYLFFDLMQLYVKEFNLFQNVFENQSTKFYASMQHINEFRIDAHAKEISEDDYQMVMLEFRWLEKCLAHISK